MNMSALRALVIYVFAGLIILSTAFPEKGKWKLEFRNVHETHGVVIRKSLFKNSQIVVNMDCSSTKKADLSIIINHTLIEIPCWNEYLRYGDEESEKDHLILGKNYTVSQFIAKSYQCISHIQLQDGSKDGKAVAEPLKNDQPKTEHLVGADSEVDPKQVDSDSEEEKRKIKREDKTEADAKHVAAESSNPVDKAKPQNHPKVEQDRLTPAYITNADGLYLLYLQVYSLDQTKDFNLTIEVQVTGPHGYLSAVDWPLLPFYGAMCLVYVVLGLAWLIVSFCQWRDLLRIQFWIGGVILLGMLEKATFYAEYQSINSTGRSVKGAVLLAELVSCAKRMLARMLVIIVSLGFGIVKPRLGPMLHRVVFTGVLYFILASVESYLRVMHRKNDPSNQILVASIPLAVLDSAICWWIFTSLVQTTRTLRLRRNLVKLSLYRHFTNTLIFSVVSSVVFMLYSIRFHRLASCLTDWKELWVDDAYWHLLFSVLLLVIMILWRPTNNNQRYAFTPLLDAPEDDEEEDEQFINDAFGVKMRGYRSNSPKPKSTNTVEDDLKWVEENIPSSMADTALPILDSDEEIMTTKFEVSKMQ